MFSCLLVIISCLLQVPGDASRLSITDRDQAKLKGPVKVVFSEGGTFVYESKEQPVEQCCWALQRDSYDEGGKLSDRQNLTSLAIDKYEANSTGKPEYDEKGRLIAERFYSPDGALLSKTQFSYSRGNLAREESVRADGSVYYRKDYLYDEKQNLAEVTTAYSKDEPSQREVYAEYDSFGNWLRRVTYARKGNQWRPTIVLWRRITYYTLGTKR